ncbi:hypothetical protein HMI56_001781 [Coelomomyces lativittatus]|nr:hypothetical protein HMI56_001781 [Coelomomyces lativittatus]
MAGNFFSQLKERFKIQSLGHASTILGIQLHKNTQGYSLSQKNFISQSLKKYGLKDVKLKSTPALETTHLE